MRSHNTHVRTPWNIGFKSRSDNTNGRTQSNYWPKLCELYEETRTKLSSEHQPRYNKELFEAVRDRRENLGLDRGSFRLSPTNYVEPLRKLLKAEEIYEGIDVRRHDLVDLLIEPTAPFTAKFVLPGLSKGQPSLTQADKVVLSDGHECIVCDITCTSGDSIEIRSVSGLIGKKCYNVSILLSGTTYQRYHATLDNLSQQVIARSLFECSPTAGSSPDPNNGLVIDMSPQSNTVAADRLEACNTLQRQAIVGMIEAECRPKPYILFGPPGTGKSFTVVEAVIQVYLRAGRSRVLVCVNQNNCADQLAADLHGTQAIDRCDLVRLRSKSNAQSPGNSARPKLRCRSTTTNRFGRAPAAEHSRVVVTSTYMAAVLQEPFDFVFVDEAGHAHEPDTLVAMSRLKPGGRFVLAGDPRQLGPVIHCQQVERLGLGVSLLERLFTFDVYSRKAGQYDRRFITKLTDSYRCDPRILNLSSKLFYHDELNCLGKTPEQLLRKLELTSPLVFKQVSHGAEDKVHSSHSRYNKMEVEACVDLVMELYAIGVQPHQVGVISPYALQKQFIYRRLHERVEASLRKLNSNQEKLLLREPDGDIEDYIELQYGDEAANNDDDDDDDEEKKGTEAELDDDYYDDSYLDGLADEFGSRLSLDEDDHEMGSTTGSSEQPAASKPDEPPPPPPPPAETRQECNLSKAINRLHELERSLDETLASRDSAETLEEENLISKEVTRLRCQVTAAEKALCKLWMCKVDTVDAFQGNERAIIIISTVRTPNVAGRIDQPGFLNDSKRFNVALSRAKWLAMVIGHPKVMECHGNWSEFKRRAQTIC